MSVPLSAPRPLRILLAEDDDELRSLLTLVLARVGHRVVALEDGYELADYVMLTRSCGGPLEVPDVILTDVRMPGRTGLEVLAQVRGLGLGCPFIVLSSFADDETREEARRLGVKAFLDKPVDPEELKATVREAALAGHEVIP